MGGRGRGRQPGRSGDAVAVDRMAPRRGRRRGTGKGRGPLGGDPGRLRPPPRGPGSWGEARVRVPVRLSRERREGDAGNVTFTQGRRHVRHRSVQCVRSNPRYAGITANAPGSGRGGVMPPWHSWNSRDEPPVPVTEPPENSPSRASRRRPQPARVASETPGAAVPNRPGPESHCPRPQRPRVTPSRPQRPRSTTFDRSRVRYPHPGMIALS